MPPGDLTGTLLGWLLRIPNGAAIAWGWAAAGLVLATPLRLALDLAAPGLALFPFYLPAVLLAALAGGARVGLAITAGAVLLARYIILPPRLGLELDLPTALNLGGFAVIAAFGSLLAARLRATYAALRELNESLETRVAERTEALAAEVERR